MDITSIPELTLARIALDIDAPAAPAHIPPNPAQAVETCQQYLARCHQQLTMATTPQEQREAELWVMNAERQLTRWRMVADRTVTV